MNKIITPRDAVAVVLERKTKNIEVSFKPYGSKFQKISFIGTITCVIASIGVGLIFRFLLPLAQLEWVALVLLTGADVFGVLYQAAILAPEFSKFKNIERDVVTPLAKTFNDDMDLIQHLANSFESRHLSYAQAMYSSMAQQMRERIGLLVGALDKIGVIPVIVTTSLAYLKAINDGIVFGPYAWISIALVVLYLLAIRMVSAAQWMERIATLYAHAHAIQTTGSPISRP